MFQLLLQMLLISCLGATGQRRELQKEKEGLPHILPQDRDLLTDNQMDYKGILAKPSLSMEDPLADMESKLQDAPKMSKFIFPHVESHTASALGSWAPMSQFLHSEDRKSSPSHPHRKREAELPFRRDAKRFWDLFMLKTKSRSEEVILPIKTNEMYEEICSTLPFSQNIVHENCEDMVVQNNLCFGKCSSFHVPGLEDRLYTFCSHCLPTKFSLKRLEMNCTNPVPVIKVVMIVEECKCEVQKAKDPQIGFLHSDLYANVYQHH
ncbi:cerberus [Tiliqua scincoides]|uniref:cerberus n=1 Tax=Tiliqua scincoides TaxID=71010 RepID=UPI003461E14C